MVKSNINISLIRKAIEKEKGKDVNVRVNLGRNKFVSYKGRITNVYPALFTVSPYESVRTVASFVVQLVPKAI